MKAIHLGEYVKGAHDIVVVVSPTFNDYSDHVLELDHGA